MEYNELKTFITVAKLNSFSVAAEKLFLSQPAISKRIASLETKLGTKLFDRIGHQLALTEAGEALLPRAQSVVAELEDIKRGIGNLSGNMLSGSIEGKLTLGASHHVGLRRLPPILKSYSKKFPKVDLDINFMDSEQAHDAILSGEIELAIATLPNKNTPRIESTKVWNDPLHIVVSHDHQLAKAKMVSLKDLSKYKAILPSEKTFTRRIIEEKFKEEKIPIQTAMNTNYIETIRMMVAIGMGWSALPETLINQDLTILKLKHLTLHRSLGCIYHQERTLSNAASAFIELIKNNHTGNNYAKECK